MKKLIERIKDAFRKDKLPQDISNHLSSTRNINDFFRKSKDGEAYIPIPKENSVASVILDYLRGSITKESVVALCKYAKSPERVIDWEDSINKTKNMHSYLSSMNFNKNLDGRGYTFISNYKENKKELMDGNDYILN